MFEISFSAGRVTDLNRVRDERSGMGAATDSARITGRWLHGSGRSFALLPFGDLVPGSGFPYLRSPVRASGRDAASVRRKHRGEDPLLVALKGEQFFSSRCVPDLCG